MAGPCSSFMRVPKITTTSPKQAVVAERLLGRDIPRGRAEFGHPKLQIHAQNTDICLEA